MGQRWDHRSPYHLSTLERRKTMESTRDFKRRRMQLRKSKKRKYLSQSVREGASYSSGVALRDTQDINKIPDPISRRQQKEIESRDDFIFVAFDLETTALSTDSDIAQIDCKCKIRNLADIFCQRSLSHQRRLPKLAFHIPQIGYGTEENQFKL